MGKKAVTLIELVIVIAIISAIGGITVVGFFGFHRLRIEQDKILSDISLVREMAEGNHQNYRIVFDIDNYPNTKDTYTIQEWDDASSSWVAYQQIPIRRVSVDITQAPNSITFQPIVYDSGSSFLQEVVQLNPAVTIQLEYRGKQKEISISELTGTAYY